MEFPMIVSLTLNAVPLLVLVFLSGYEAQVT